MSEDRPDADAAGEPSELAPPGTRERAGDVAGPQRRSGRRWVVTAMLIVGALLAAFLVDRARRVGDDGAHGSAPRAGGSAEQVRVGRDVDDDQRDAEIGGQPSGRLEDAGRLLIDDADDDGLPGDGCGHERLL